MRPKYVGQAMIASVERMSPVRRAVAAVGRTSLEDADQMDVLIITINTDPSCLHHSQLHQR